MTFELMAVGSCALLLAWLLVTEWIPLPPLNDLEASTSNQRLRIGLANYTVLAVIAAGVLLGSVAGATVAALLSAAWLVGHVIAWWLPYIGLSTKGQRDAYAREYVRTLKVLPTDGHDVVIDVQHMVVGALTLPMVLFVSLHLGATLDA